MGKAACLAYPDYRELPLCGDGHSHRPRDDGGVYYVSRLHQHYFWGRAEPVSRPGGPLDRNAEILQANQNAFT